MKLVTIISLLDLIMGALPCGRPPPSPEDMSPFAVGLQDLSHLVSLSLGGCPFALGRILYLSFVAVISHPWPHR